MRKRISKQGITQEDIKEVIEIKKKANTQQLRQIIKEYITEYYNRKDCSELIFTEEE